MRLKVVEIEDILIVGIEVDLDFDWDEFFEAPNPILSKIADVVEDNTFYYVADAEKSIFGRRVHLITQIPEGCVVVTVPSGTYARLHKSQSTYEHDMFAMTNYESIEKVEFRTITPRLEHSAVEYLFRPVEYLQDAINIRKIPVLSKELSLQLREHYINKFFDVKSNCVKDYFYKRYITQGKGYLWNFIKDEKKAGLTVSEVWDFFNEKEEILFFWDSTSSIGREFTRNKVFKLNAIQLLQSYTRFAFDLYIFDTTLTWTVIFQHEEDDEGYKCFLIKSN
ncbi:hypothetical protein NDK47_24660 [Brevibacillus ruminantium]|uniref:Uncharacterized protein n=1 Tax=Brevibacillus ruminantium TaxID=2950604 RepID=A0ABY4WDM0_9BACL|nr:hypothetical protein [Brevibacillus ruminantium]USG65262.1 hypothetical protein NDK47_24660 [Brevibacillus ruminantium]